MLLQVELNIRYLIGVIIIIIIIATNTTVFTLSHMYQYLIFINSSSF
jgi:hypothetical protein